MEINESKVYRITNVSEKAYDGKTILSIVADDNAKTTAGYRVALKKATQNDSQGWMFKKTGDNIYQIYPYTASDIALHGLIMASMTGDGVNLQAKDNSLNQSWEIVSRTDGFYKLRVKNDKESALLVLRLGGGGSEPDTEPDNGAWDDRGRWKIEEITDLNLSLLDTSKKETADSIKNQLNKIRINNLIDTSTGTKEKPVKVKCGFVFCDFKDKTGKKEDIAGLYNQIIGATEKGNELNNFIKTESNGKVELELGSAPADWISLPGNNTAYKDKVNDVFKDLDAKTDVPDCKILFIVFPKDALEMSFSQMCGDRIMDVSKKLNIVFLDPTVYSEVNNDLLWTTIHETMHALGLPDLYSRDLTKNRSFGWSLMADCRTGWHITGLEKLVLGWHSLDDYYFLKSGVLKADIFEQNSGDNKKKGIVILPDDLRPDCYYMEIGQEIGRTDEDRKKFNRKGLLLINVRLGSGSGQMSPYVSAAGNDNNFGGASKATFIAGENFKTMGIFSVNGFEYKDGKINCTVGLDPTYKVPDSVKYLREGEWIATADNSLKFKLDIRGKLNDSCNYNSVNANGKINLPSEYGYYAGIDDLGRLAVYSGTNSSGQMLFTFEKSDPKLPTGKYFMKVENSAENGKRVAVYSGKPGDAKAVYQYTLFNFS